MFNYNDHSSASLFLYFQTGFIFNVCNIGIRPGYLRL